MKWLCLFLLSNIVFMANSQDISAYRWKQRIVIIQEDEHELMEAYRDSLGIKERKLIFFEAGGDALTALNTSEPIQLKKPYFLEQKYRFYLIGLDGSIKVKKESPLSQKELFSLIDQMPMRIHEIKGGNE